jgi:cellulose synthase/poly-beta-1,6-N-acetylglucosamine synthase-like glycosyltransferase
MRSAAVRFGSSSEEEVPLNWNDWVRQLHRWLSIAFATLVVANILVMGRGDIALWVGGLTLLPLGLLLLSGLYLFALPYAVKWRSVQRTGGWE